MSRSIENRIKRKEPLKIGEDPEQFYFEIEKYDLDLMDIYKSMRRIFSDPLVVLKPSINKLKFLENIQESIKIYCFELEIDFEYYMNTELPLIVFPINNSSYRHWLRYSLITYDTFEIPSYLKYHQVEYKKLNRLKDDRDFIDWIEFFVPDFIKRESPVEDEVKRLNTIMQWVYQERIELSKKKKLHKPTLQNFDQLYKKSTYNNIIISILKKNSIISNDLSWKGTTEIKTECLSLIDVLRDKTYIKKNSQTLTVKLFCNKFKIDLKDRSSRSKSKKSDDFYQYYFKIIPALEK